MESRRTAEELLNIGELAELTGVSSRTIRYYEELGILPQPQRSAGGTRRYPRDHRFYIEGAKALKELGFNLEEIRVIGRLALGRPTSGAEREHAATVVRDRTRALEHRIRVLTALRDLLASPEVSVDGTRRRRGLLVAEIAEIAGSDGGRPDVASEPAG